MMSSLFLLSGSVYLTSSSVESRCSGMKLLSSVIIQLNAHSHKLPLEDGQFSSVLSNIAC